MLTIVIGLLTAWILKLFGFFGVVSAGMLQLFGIQIDILGYYFIFALIAFARIAFSNRSFKIGEIIEDIKGVQKNDER